MEKYSKVEYDTGEGTTLAFVAEDTGSDTRLDLFVFDPKDGQSSLVKSVPRRDEGGGKTWKPISK